MRHRPRTRWCGIIFDARASHSLGATCARRCRETSHFRLLGCLRGVKERPEGSSEFGSAFRDQPGSREVVTHCPTCPASIWLTSAVCRRTRSAPSRTGETRGAQGRFPGRTRSDRLHHNGLGNQTAASGISTCRLVRVLSQPRLPSRPRPLAIRSRRRPLASDRRTAMLRSGTCRRPTSRQTSRPPCNGRTTSTCRSSP